ncbi:MAG: hypothetical protein AXA67_13820 [Methylothermaceae bacteria B42]|nr:MAG: hypothetical protein AXA67_13820 [Methylothermaceae bacteria B42]HHJ38297.1 hypothetical protein [Methylothermaceae bacterium]
MTAPRLALLFVLMAVLAGLAVDWIFSNALDYWVHDAAVVYRARKQWRHIGIVVLDHQVPVRVGRKQTLPLFALATERLILAGAKGVFMDARLSKELETNMPYALCLDHQGEGVRWSSPHCVAKGTSQCLLASSEAGTAPLKLSQQAIVKFKVAPYLPGQAQLPDFLLYGWEASMFIPEQGLVVSDRLVTKRSSILRWMDLSDDHAVIQLAKWVAPEKVNQALTKTRDNELCDGRYSCRRIRLSHPLYQVSLNNGRLLAPVSLLASCQHREAMRIARLFEGKAVILQLTSPSESTDMVVTPMTTAWWGPHLLTPGSQYLADAVETLLSEDHPRAPPLILKILLFAAVAILSVFLGLRQRQIVLWSGSVLVLIGLIGICFWQKQMQLWPVVASMAVYLSGAFQVTGLNLVVGMREGNLIRQYMPDQIHDLLISLRQNQRFRNQRYETIVLMSDLTHYTTVTGLLKDPAYVLELMNDYLQETSLVLQKKYQGWLESYVGDMVCYYWPVWKKDRDEIYRNALLGALEMARLQKNFFSTLPQRYAHRFPEQALKQVAAIINAGIGLASGKVVMGDIGPSGGVRKFGILGDPLNLAARLESLTRLFTTDIIASEEFIPMADLLQIAHRRLGKFMVKGRVVPVTIYALGESRDPRFSVPAIRAWERWLEQVENGKQPVHSCPEMYMKDCETLRKWEARNLFNSEGIWVLDEK